MLINHSRTANAHNRHGFTLVELSIAIVIIGLLIGGVLVGRDLISAAEVKAGIHQIEGYQTAINNFRLRYRAIPGDMGDATTQFSNTSWPNLENGDADGTLRDGDWTVDDPDTFEDERDQFTGELPQFWYHLTAAKMLDKQFDGGYTLGESFPESKVGSGGIIAYGISDDANYFYIGAITPTNTTTFAIKTANSMTPDDALKMDQKMDDGHPYQGSVRARGGANFEGDVLYSTVAWLNQAPIPHAAQLALHTLGQWIVPTAHASGEEAGNSREACTYVPASGVDNAYYASAAGGRNCQLRVRWK